VFGVDTESLKLDATSTHVPICVSTYAKIFILSFAVNRLHLPLLVIFHPLAVKFVFYKVEELG
jgi:hypothetical protein